MNIYVGNLHYEIDEDQLKEIFEEYGEVSSSKIIMDRETGRSKGFGFIEMPNDEEANNAMGELNDAELKGRNMRVNEARERTGGGGGGGRDRRSNFRQR
ncbi:MAG TPA: RNA-binding protein [Bacteroidales bacterium]|nr:RNA-binding protein [Bacteroidales bacterium]